jgi:DNA-binding beta-propeller fold protein YncE
MNIINVITIVKAKIKYSFYCLLQFFWLIYPKRTVRRIPRTKKHPWTELSGVLYIPGNIFSLRLLCLQRIDLRTGAIQKNIFKESGHGHSVICAKIGKGWLVPENGYSIIEFDLQTLRQTNRITSDMNLIGGHGSCSTDGSRLYFVDRSICDKALESNLVVYDTIRRKIIHKYERVGIYPHDVKITSDGKKAIVASYGGISTFFGKLPASYSEQSKSLRKPSFTIIDLQRNVINSKYAFTDNFTLAHVALDQNEEFAFIQGTIYLKMSECSKKSISLIIQRRNLPVTNEEMISGIVFTSGVLLKVDIENTKVMRLDHLFPRPQSVVFSKLTGMVYETFGYANMVGVLDKETLDMKKQYNFSGLGFVDPRGLALSADERFLFVSGRRKNVYCLDLCSGNKLGRQVIYTSNNINSHITSFWM